MESEERERLIDRGVEELVLRVEGDCALIDSLVISLQALWRELPAELPDVIDSAQIERLDEQSRQVESALRLVTVNEAMEPLHEFREHLSTSNMSEAALSWGRIHELLHSVSRSMLLFRHR